MVWLLLATRVICTVEGAVGAFLNLYLLYLVVVSRKSTMSDRVYKVAISIFSVHGSTLCTFIAIMNYAHIFREGTFITAVVGPLASFLPNTLSMIIIRTTMVLVTMVWTMITAMSTLQLITLTRTLQWSASKRLLISFLFPCLCIAIVATTVEELIPSQDFEKIMIRISQEVYDMNGTLITFGSTMRYPEKNYDRTLVYFALFYAIVPYSLTYGIQSRLRIRGMTLSRRTIKMQRAFFVMQLLQTVLPLVILSSPITVFLYGVFTQTDLGLSALWFTSFLWLCTSVQALVQLRYIRQGTKTKAKVTSQMSVISTRSKGSSEEITRLWFSTTVSIAQLRHVEPSRLHLVCIWTLDGSAILCNLPLIIAIILKTPKPMRTYSVFLLNNAIIDFASAIASALGTVRIVQDHEGSMIFVFLGPCTLINEDLCRFCQGLHINLVQHSAIVLLLSFAYRLYLIGDVFEHRRTITPLQVWFACLLSLTLMGIPIAAYYYEQTNVTPEMMNKLNLDGYVASNYNNFGSTRAILLDALGVTLSPIIMTLIFVVRHKLLSRIEQAKSTEKRLHVSIARALTYQLLLPCGVASAAVFWLLDVTEIWSSEFSERVIVLTCSIFSLASPLINFAMLPPYRAIFQSTKKMHSIAPNLDTFTQQTSQQIAL